MYVGIFLIRQAQIVYQLEQKIPVIGTSSQGNANNAHAAHTG